MAGKQWIMGCGIGCLAVVVVLVIAGGVMVSKVKDTVAEFEDVGETQAELSRLYGDIEDYTPPADGGISADRVETFLRVQEQIHGPSLELAAALVSVRSLEEGGFSLSKIKSAFQGLGSLGTGAGRYISTRNEALLEHEMGFGEFTYLSSLVYYGWLGKSLVLSIDGGDDGDEIRRWARVSKMFKGLLLRQRDAARDAGDPGGIVSALEFQLSELALDDEWVPWVEGGLPASTEDSLAPYRERFEALYADTGALLGVAPTAPTAGSISRSSKRRESWKRRGASRRPFLRLRPVRFRRRRGEAPSSCASAPRRAEGTRSDR